MLEPLYKFIRAHHAAFRRLTIGVACLITLSVLVNISFWAAAFKVTWNAFDDLSGQTKLAIVFGSIVLGFASLLKMNFTGKFSWALAQETLLKWLKGVIWISAAWLAVLLLHVFFVAPPTLHHSKTKEIDTATNENAGLRTENAGLRNISNNLWATGNSLLEQLRKSTNGSPITTALGDTTNFLAQNTAKMLEAARRQEKANAESGKGGSDYLSNIVNRAVTLPNLATGSKIELSQVNELADKLEELQIKKVAEDELKRRDNSSKHMVTFRTSAPIVDHYVSTFTNALRNLAEQYGDKLITKYTSAFELGMQPQGKDFAEIYFEKNAEWAFQVYFRNVNNDALFHWEIYCAGVPKLMSKFNGEDFDYNLLGTKYHDSLKIDSLNTTNLVPMFTWLIASHKFNHPLTNTTPISK